MSSSSLSLTEYITPQSSFISDSISLGVYDANFGVFAVYRPECTILLYLEDQEIAELDFAELTLHIATTNPSEIGSHTV